MIKVVELFSGYGSQSLALENIGLEHEVVAISDIDKYALQAYSQLHEGNCPNLGDITKIKEIEHCDLLTYSFPCFKKGTKVLTDCGYKNIEEIKTGDFVMTHKNRFKKVIMPMINKANHIYELKTMCSENIFVTEEHPFLIKERYRVWNNDKRVYDRKFKQKE